MKNPSLFMILGDFRPMGQFLFRQVLTLENLNVSIGYVTVNRLEL